MKKKIKAQDYIYPDVSKVKSEKRKLKMDKWLSQGKSFGYIGEKLELSRERVRQLMNYYGLRPSFDLGQQKNVEAGKKKRKEVERKLELKNLQYIKKNGHPRIGYGLDLTPRQKRILLKFKTKKNSAKRDGVPFTINIEDIEFPKHCPVFGIKLLYGAYGKNPRAASFDRTNPKLGYIKGNVKIISMRANWIKSNASPQELILLGEYARKYMS